MCDAVRLALFGGGGRADDEWAGRLRRRTSRLEDVDQLVEE
jgi:hypothetical protein